MPDTTRQLTAAVDAVCGADPAQLADAEIIQLLHCQLERLNTATVRATAAFDAGRAWEGDGARSAAAWVAVRCHLPVATARRRVRLGRAVRHMPAVEAAWLAGDVGEAHAALLAAARTPATAQCFERDEARLVEQACDLRYSHFARAVASWSQLADPEGTDGSERAQHHARRVHLSQSFADSWVLDGVLDPVNGTIVASALRRIEDELFAADWAEAREQLGEAAGVGDLSRTAAQRRADALVEMARRA